MVKNSLVNAGDIGSIPESGRSPGEGNGNPPWSAAYQDPPSMGFSRQVYWSGVPSPSPK